MLDEERDYGESKDEGQLTKKHLTLLLIFFSIMITIFAFTESWYYDLRTLNEGSIERWGWFALILGSILVGSFILVIFSLNNNKECAIAMIIGFLLVWAILMLSMLCYPESCENKLEIQNEIHVENLYSINATLEHNITMFVIDFNDVGNYSIKLNTLAGDKCIVDDFYADGVNMSYEFDRSTVSLDMYVLVVGNEDTGSMYTARLNVIHNSIFG